MNKREVYISIYSFLTGILTLYILLLILSKFNIDLINYKNANVQAKYTGSNIYKQQNQSPSMTKLIKTKSTQTRNHSTESDKKSQSNPKKDAQTQIYKKYVDNSTQSHVPGRNIEVQATPYGSEIETQTEVTPQVHSLTQTDIKELNNSFTQTDKVYNTSKEVQTDTINNEYGFDPAKGYRLTNIGPDIIVIRPNPSTRSETPSIIYYFRVISNYIYNSQFNIILEFPAPPYNHLFIILNNGIIDNKDCNMIIKQFHRKPRPLYTLFKAFFNMLLDTNKIYPKSFIICEETMLINERDKFRICKEEICDRFGIKEKEIDSNKSYILYRFLIIFFKSQTRNELVKDFLDIMFDKEMEKLRSDLSSLKVIFHLTSFIIEKPENERPIDLLDYLLICYKKASNYAIPI